MSLNKNPLLQEQTRFTIRVEQTEGYEFKVKFDWDDTQDLLMDEPAPLGEQQGPNASRLLAAAVANCLSASLLFCLKKNDSTQESISAEVTCILARNEQKRLRIGALEVAISLDTEIFDETRLKRCLQMFEDFCVVSASVRQGIPIAVNVVDQQGTLLHQSH